MTWFPRARTLRQSLSMPWFPRSEVLGPAARTLASIAGQQMDLRTDLAGYTDGQSVSTFFDTVNGRNLVAPSGSNEGLYNAAAGGVDFDGVDDVYQAADRAAYNFLHQGDSTIAVVIDHLSNVSGLQALLYTGLDAPGGILLYSRVGQLNVILSNDTARIAAGAGSTALLVNTRHVVVQVIDGATVSWYVDGVAAGSRAITGGYGTLDSEVNLHLGRFGTSWATGASVRRIVGYNQAHHDEVAFITSELSA